MKDHPKQEQPPLCVTCTRNTKYSTNHGFPVDVHEGAVDQEAWMKQSSPNQGGTSWGIPSSGDHLVK